VGFRKFDLSRAKRTNQAESGSGEAAPKAAKIGAADWEPALPAGEYPGKLPGKFERSFAGRWERKIMEFPGKGMRIRAAGKPPTPAVSREGGRSFFLRESW
jgi:hypothetical protein